MNPKKRSKVFFITLRYDDIQHDEQFNELKEEFPKSYATLIVNYEAVILHLAANRRHKWTEKALRQQLKRSGLEWRTFAKVIPFIEEIEVNEKDGSFFFHDAKRLLEKAKVISETNTANIEKRWNGHNESKNDKSNDTQSDIVINTSEIEEQDNAFAIDDLERNYFNQ